MTSQATGAGGGGDGPTVGRLDSLDTDEENSFEFVGTDGEVVDEVAYTYADPLAGSCSDMTVQEQEARSAHNMSLLRSKAIEVAGVKVGFSRLKLLLESTVTLKEGGGGEEGWEHVSTEEGSVSGDEVVERGEEVPDEPLAEVDECLAQKIRYMCGQFVLGTVRSLHPGNINTYLDVLGRHYQVAEPDRPSLEAELRAVCRRGPALTVRCTRGKLSKQKVYGNLQVVAYFRRPSDTGPLTGEQLVAPVTMLAPHDMEFDLSGRLVMPGFDNDVLRIEVRKVKAAGYVKGRELVGFVDVKMDNLPSSPYENYFNLTKGDRGGADGGRKISLTGGESPGNLYVYFEKHSDEPAACRAASALLQDYFWRLAKTVLAIKSEPGPLEHVSTKYQLRVEREGDENPLKEMAWQKLKTEEGNHGRKEDRSCVFPVDCILSNVLDVGVDFKRRSLSPSVVQSFGGSSTSLNLSPTPDKSRKKSVPSILDNIGQRVGGSIGKKLGDNLRGATESLTNLDLLSSSGSKSSWHSEALHALLPPGRQHVVRLADKTRPSWRLRLDTLSGCCLTEQELRLLFTRAVLSAILEAQQQQQQEEEGEQQGGGWRGELAPPVASLFRIFEPFYEMQELSFSAARAQAYCLAHRYVKFDHSFLTPHLKVLAEEAGGLSGSAEEYKLYALRLLARHRSTDQKELATLLNNLAVFLTTDNSLVGAVEEVIRRDIVQVYSLWRKEEAQKVTKDSYVGPGQFMSQSTRSYLICTGLLNQYILPDIQVECKNYIENFTDLLSTDYKQLATQVYFAELKSNLEGAGDFLKRESASVAASIANMKVYDESVPLVFAHLQAYNCFSAFRRLFKYTVCPDTNWIYEHFSAHPNIWMHLAVSKAAKHIDGLVQHIKSDQRDAVAAPGDDQMSRQLSAGDKDLQRQESADTATDVLYALNDISQSCWRFWRELSWPSVETTLSTGFILIEGLSRLTEKIPQVYETIHMEDSVLDAKELVSTVRILHGLKKLQRGTVEEIVDLHEKIALDRVDMNENSPANSKDEDDAFKAKMAKCYETIQRSCDKTTEEIQNKISCYTKGRRPVINKYLEDKKIYLGPDTDSLLLMVDSEAKVLFKGLERINYGTESVQKLWDTMESCFLEYFELKKERNLKKNKPARFEHIQSGLEEIMRGKQDLYQDGILKDGNIDKLNKVKKELTILVAPASSLIKSCLRQKAREQEMDEQSGSLARAKVRLGYISSRDRVSLELVSLHGIRPREGKSASRLQVYVRFYPDKDGKVEAVNKTQQYPDVAGALAFDLLGEPVVYSFGVGHVVAKRQFEDIFAIVSVFDINQLGKKIFVGEAVFQVKFNGILKPELVDVTTDYEFRTEVPPLTYRLHQFNNLYASDEYVELSRRASRRTPDGEAASFVSKEEKLRSKAPFHSLS